MDKEVERKLLTIQKELKAPKKRSISSATVSAYADDMIAGRWKADTGVPIVFNKKGILEDGQHRLMAVVKAGIPVTFQICYNAGVAGIYDENRRRTAANFASRYFDKDDNPRLWTTNTLSIARCILRMKYGHGRVTQSRQVQFVDDNRELFEIYFGVIPSTHNSKTSIAPVQVALFLAIANGASHLLVGDFYKVLNTGFPSNDYDVTRQYPIMKLRDYLLNLSSVSGGEQKDVILRTQYALSKFLSCSRVKNNKPLPTFRWGYEILFKGED